LLPDSFPTLDGFDFANLYRPCEAVGGDFHDFVLDDDRITILVSDVIGHGVQAALSTMLLKGIFQETAIGVGDPIELLKEMNGRLHRIIPEGMYAAASVIMLNPGNPELCFANAGLPYPFILRREEKRVDEIALAGPPLGLFGDIGIVQYESRSSQLESGDVFLIGSDGIGSIEGEDDEIFEDKRLRQVLGNLAGLDGEKVIEQLMEQATLFSNGRPQPDDVNLVAITSR
jgi:serine phosphatase RsbU (regulator of sigma subunit)